MNDIKIPQFLTASMEIIMLVECLFCAHCIQDNFDMQLFFFKYPRNGNARSQCRRLLHVLPQFCLTDAHLQLSDAFLILWLYFPATDE